MEYLDIVAHDRRVGAHGECETGICRAACDDHLAYGPQRSCEACWAAPVLSPFVRRALAAELPAKDLGR